MGRMQGKLSLGTLLLGAMPAGAVVGHLMLRDYRESAEARAYVAQGPYSVVDSVTCLGTGKVLADLKMTYQRDRNRAEAFDSADQLIVTFPSRGDYTVVINKMVLDDQGEGIFKIKEQTKKLRMPFRIERSGFSETIPLQGLNLKQGEVQVEITKKEEDTIDSFGSVVFLPVR